MNMIRKGLVVMLLVVVLLAVLGLTLGADALFARALRSGGEAALGAPVEFSDAGLSLFAGRATVSDFRGGTETHPLLDFREAAFDVGVGAALDGRAHLEQATIEGLRIHLTVDEDGRLSWDPGPPPAEVEAEADAPAVAPDAEPLPPPADRDLVQILREYWVRYETYQGYYEAYGGFLGGGDDEEAEEDAARERGRWPGKPEAVTAAQREAAAAEESRGALWIERAAIEDFGWETLDARSGAPLLPALASCSLRMLAVGTPPDGSTPASEWSGEAALEAGGEFSFGYFGARDDAPNRLKLTATGLPIRELLPLAGSSFPFDVSEGALALLTEDFAFAADHLSGSVRLELSGAKLAARADSPRVLGVDAKEFCSLLNTALGQQPVAFVIRLGGTPAAPKFEIENQTDLGDMLGGAIKAEVERRAREFVAEQQQALEQKADEIKQGLEQNAEEIKQGLEQKAEEAKTEATQKLEQEVGSRVGNLIGGKKRGG